MIVSQSQTPNHLLSAALSYAQRGWRVLPVHTMHDGQCTCENPDCTSRGKHPLLRNGLHGACCEDETIDRWWSEAPIANVSITTGPESGVWVLDADGAAGLAALAELESQNGPLPRTPTVRTGGGGKHLYFRWAAGVEIRNTTKVDQKPVDVRGLGGYVIAPPSLHASGAAYAWEITPDEVEPAEAPSWLVAKVTRKSADSQVCKPPLRAEDLVSASGAREGSRHDNACSLVGRELRKGQDPDIVRQQALEWARRCDPAFPEDEILRIVADLVAKQAAQTSLPLNWEPPTAFQEFETPPFPTDALPDWLQDFVESLATATQTPPDLAAMLVLAVVAASCAKTVEVRIDDGYAEPLNSYAAVSMAPANRKSAVFSEVTAPLTEFERSETQRLAPSIAEAKARIAIDDGRLKRLQDDAIKAKTPAQQETLIQQTADLAREMAATRIPTVPRILACDTTAEKLEVLLAENGGRMAVLSPEGDVFDMIAGRYNGKGSTPNLGVFLKGHSGDEIRVDRVGRPPEFVKSPALTIGMTVQPEVIRGLAQRPGFRGRGLLARILFSIPKSLLGQRDTDPPPIPPGIRSEYRRLVVELLQLRPLEVVGGEAQPHPLQLSPDANSKRLELAARMEPQLGEEGELSNIADWGGKLVGEVLRVAGILHMAEYAGEPLPWNVPIAGETMERAITVGEYLIAHAHAAFAEMGADPSIADARFMLRWITRRGTATFTKRDLFEGTKGRFKRVDALGPGLALLVSHGYVRELIYAYPTGPGRRPSPTFEVNPLTASQFSQNAHNPLVGLGLPRREGDSAIRANCATPVPFAKSSAPAPTPSAYLPPT